MPCSAHAMGADWNSGGANLSAVPSLQVRQTGWHPSGIHHAASRALGLLVRHALLPAVA